MQLERKKESDEYYATPVENRSAYIMTLVNKITPGKKFFKYDEVKKNMFLLN
jgi:hypothetical protein